MQKAILSLAALVLVCGEARAMHPLISEDAGFLGKGGRQVETGFEYSVSKEGADIYPNSPAAEISCGLSDKTDLLLTVPWRGWSSSGEAERGLGDLAGFALFACGVVVKSGL